jgi:PAS domain S-box-containing protein
VPFTDAPRVRVDGDPDGVDAVRAALPRPLAVVDANPDCRVRAVGPDEPGSAVALDDADVVVTTEPRPSLLGRAAAAGAASLSLDDEQFRRHLVASISRVAEDRTVRRRAERFDAVFEDPDAFVAVVDSNGRLCRRNEAFADAGDVADSLWDLPWWTDPEAVREWTDRATDGERVAFETTCRVDGDDRTVAFSLRPVSADGQVRSVVVEGRDVTERARLAEDLRASEELHRVTLNNMTDTVLITDDDGAFTYVCPNVHFIFGYTAAEIRDLGSIDELLGTDLYDAADLDETDVLTNIETTAVDKAGNEHTLLVNVRRVDIQGGTTLFSCRDITKRKQRERALAHLHRTARDLLYAETVDDIGEQVVDDGLDVLSVPATAVYRFDAGESVLRPVAQSDGFVDRFGAARDRPLTTDDPLGDAFVSGATRRLDADAAPAGLGNVLVVPLGDHGVFVAGTPAETVDDVTRELADLLSATAEAALDRVARESDLRARDRTLQERNRQLTRLNRVNDLIREIDQSLLRAETREEVEAAVCDRLTTADRFAFAWVGDAPPGDRTLRPRAWAGDGRGYLDDVSLALDGDGDGDAERDPACRTANTHTASVVDNVATGLRDASWRRAALSQGYQSAVSVPLRYDGAFYGVLAVYGTQPDAFDETTQAVLEELGETVAAAVSSVERRRALVSDTVVEVTLEVTDTDCVFRRLARDAGCSVVLRGGVQDTEDGLVVFVGVEDGSATDFVATARDSIAVVDARAVGDASDASLVQLTLERPILPTQLADHGAVLRRLRATPEGVDVVVDVPDSEGVRTVLGVLDRRYPDFRLAGRRERRQDPASDAQFRDDVLDRLTDRQLEVVRTAYYAGYFERPRRATGTDLAGVLDISSAAFSKHVRVVERKLFGVLLDVEADGVNI